MAKGKDKGIGNLAGITKSQLYCNNRVLSSLPKMTNEYVKAYPDKEFIVRK